MSNKINSAIWIDSGKAYVLIDKNGEESFQHITSEIEHQVRYDGETDTASRFGTQYVDKEKKLSERRKHQEHDYFKKIVKHLENVDQIMICGPAQTKKGLEKEINSIKSMQGKIVDVLPADSMTENQIRAHLKNYFSK